jgi:YHS domain-containing protein
MNGAICPACGCSLVRLGIPRADAVSTVHAGELYYFCCQGCADLFEQNPDKYVSEISDWIVCPACLAEKPRALAVSIEHEGQELWFCRCPCCVEEFRKRPDELIARMAA